MSLIKAVTQESDIRDMISTNEELINSAINNNMNLITRLNANIIKENLQKFVVQNNILSTYENISNAVSADIVLFIEAASLVLADTTLSNADKVTILQEEYADNSDAVLSNSEKVKELLGKGVGAVKKMADSAKEGATELHSKAAQLAADHGTSLGTVGLGAAGVLAGGYLAKKLYDRYKAKKAANKAA